jgi:membrane protease subunit HflK
MSMFLGWGARARGLFADTKGPWGSSGGGDEPPPEGGGPWGDSPKRRKRMGADPEAGVGPNLEDFLRRSRMRFGGGGGGFSGRPIGSIVMWAAIAFVSLFLLMTTFHSMAPSERGVVTQFGRYNRTLQSGIGMTLPWPIERLNKVNVEEVRNVDMGSASSEDLMLTGDQNLIDIAYTVRWNIRTPELYLFQLAQPDETINQVAESAMRAVISSVTLRDAMGDKRADIEIQVTDRMQQILDRYRSGIQIKGVAIKQADPPDAVNDAFKQVTAAQQDAKSYINQANAYALQITAKAQGESAAFDKVYEQYRLAPEVTRRRMYYETMEQVLSRVDKTIVEAPGVTPYLPLPMVQKSQQKEANQ